MTAEVSLRRSHTRDRLVEAALVVFAEKGVGGASVEEISEAAGFTRGAFYSNFESKDALCLAALDHLCNAALDAAESAIAALGDPDSDAVEELIPQAVALFLRAQRSDRTWVLASAELRLHAARESSFQQAYADSSRRATSLFAELLARTATERGYRMLIPAEDMVDALHAIVDHANVGALAGAVDPDPQVRAAQLSAVLRAMLSAD